MEINSLNGCKNSMTTLANLVELATGIITESVGGNIASSIMDSSLTQATIMQMVASRMATKIL